MSARAAEQQASLGSGGRRRVLMIAPFERGRGHGGSQRATAIAERLEERGLEIGWQRMCSNDTSKIEKLGSLLRGEPSIVGLYDRLDPLERGRWDVLLVAHSYLAPRVDEVAGDTPTIIDFHNLEWRGLDDKRTLELGGVRRFDVRPAYAWIQVNLVRRLERMIIAEHPLSLFVSEEEFGWARAAVPASGIMLVPNVLPRAETHTAAEIWSRRDPEPGHLVYVGTMSFPVNLMSLRRFLADQWPTITSARPDLRLTIAGDGPPEVRAELERHPGVRAPGFVDDLVPLLASAEAVIMPFAGRAGTSLRALFYALAGVHVIGTPDAFRGIPFAVGRAATTPAEWARAVAETLGSAPGSASAAAVYLDAARSAAQAHQSDPKPWDDLAASIARIAPGAGHGAATPPQ